MAYPHCLAFLVLSSFTVNTASLALCQESGQLSPTDPSPQKSHQIRLTNERITDQGNGITEVFQLPASGQIHHNGKAFDIVKPSMEEDSKIAYTRVYFIGQTGKIDKGIIVLIAGYDTDQAKYYADLNNNLDFTDDGDPTKAQADSANVIIELKGQNPDSRFDIELIPFQSKESMTPELMDRYQSMFKGFEEYMGGTFVDAKHWYFNRRLNTRTSSVEIDGHRTMIGLQDYDCDGLYNGERDRLMIGSYGADTISDALADGAVNITKDEIFLIEGTPYKIVEVKPDGSLVKISKTTQMPDRLFVGNSIPALKLKSFAGETVPIQELIKPGKLLVIDFWGHWCGPCIGAIPKTIEFHEKWKDKITFVGIHMGDHDKAREVIEKHQVPFMQFECTDDLEETFFIDAWPTYVVIDSDGKLVSFRSSLKTITKSLENETKETESE